MNNQQAEELLIRYQERTCSPEEKAMVESWLLDYAKSNQWVPDEAELRHAQNRIAKTLALSFRKSSGKKIKPLTITAIAASITLVVGVGLYYHKSKTSQKQNYAHDIAPGGNHATLTLASGKVINLSNTKTGVIIVSKAFNYSDGTSITEATGKTGNQAISTPIGGQYQIVLPDGTKVWLNAATTLKFPQSFNGSANRKVELSGEAYFEVAKDKAHPFIVKSKLQSLKVLGTHFNISAYEEDTTIKSTLLEGSIQINNNTILQPGEQATKTETSIHIEQVDTDNAVAWKNGEFMFRKESLESIMRKIARWYDVEVVYEDKKNQAKKLFGGEISRFTNVSEVLNMLQLTGQVHFKIEGRRIMVNK